MLIVIEGADGCGKDTVADVVALGLQCSRLSFPNDGGYTGPLIREYLRGRWEVRSRDPQGELHKDDLASAMAFQALQIANRMEVMPRLLDAELGGLQGLTTVVSRYWQSGWVYGQLDGLDREWLERVHEGMAQPSVNVLLDADASVCLARRAARDGVKQAERYEGHLAFTERVVSLYRELWDLKQRGPEGHRWVWIDARRPVWDVVGEVVDSVLHRGGEKPTDCNADERGAVRGVAGGGSAVGFRGQDADGAQVGSAQGSVGTGQASGDGTDVALKVG